MRVVLRSSPAMREINQLSRLTSIRVVTRCQR
jgi:hypothetical protein